MADEAGGSTGAGQALLDNAPLVKNVSKAVSDGEKGQIGSVGSDVANFAMGAMTVAEDPLNALISAGLGFLEDWCTPIKDCLQKVTGDPEALDKSKEAFNEVSIDIDNLAREIDNIAKTGLANWSGDAKEAATQQIETFVQGVQGTGNTAQDISELLGISATLMDAAKTIINGILATFIEWLVVTWLAALAASVFTFGASDAAATAATGAEAAVEGANAADKVEETTSLLDRITNIIKNIIEKLKSVLKDVKSAEKDLRDGKNVLKDGESAAKDGEAAAKDGEAVAKDGEGAAKDGESAAHDGEKSGGDNKTDNVFQKQWNDAKEKFNQNIQHPVQGLQRSAQERGNQSFGSYLTSHEDGEPSKLSGTLLDVGKETVSNLAGQTLNPQDDSQAEAQQNGAGFAGLGPGIDEDLQGR